MALRTITGELASWGSAEENQYGAALYTYLRFDTAEVGDGYVEGVFVVPMLDSLLRTGGTMTFYLAEVHMPRLVGSRKFHVLYAVRRQGRVTEAMAATCRLVNQQKITAWHLFLAGAVLMLAYGLGLLLWLWALRLLVVHLPTAAMRQEIQRPLPAAALPEGARP